MAHALLPMSAGFATCMSLIVSIGAQNAFVLRQGLRRHAVLLVVAICIASDVALIALGVGGFGTLVTGSPTLLTACTVAGGCFLLCYGFLAARRAFRPGTGLEAGTGATGSRRRAALTCLAMTWLNPQTYLETILLIGSVAAGYGAMRWEFGLGALAASCVWFLALGFGARLLTGLFARPGAWRVLDGVIAVMMVSLGASLLAGA
ncbi:LysE/ArgO family amino acid transporter [Saccharopolyspora dendranthemae]|uniref:L-lysine exporter family protein LysE/ArgO n=1 Tax=Saccharopolyspora dendranthemae TaxID=1181886 RepID=A0A561V706_9PSEU|nr:LysE/ArgO family amino acid transporter [Saccharopolyspora dendranthemae]TWG07401.1 L-lysine exporter family protein LysE/ArgO [Saccharopolyspora dendranthemae]